MAIVGAVVAKAVSSEPGEAIFYADTPADGALDGLQDTGRGRAKKKVTVPVTTIDTIWNDLGRATVSVIKIDIEGGELRRFKEGWNASTRTDQR